MKEELCRITLHELPKVSEASKTTQTYSRIELLTQVRTGHFAVFGFQTFEFIWNCIWWRWQLYGIIICTSYDDVPLYVLDNASNWIINFGNQWYTSGLRIMKNKDFYHLLDNEDGWWTRISVLLAAYIPGENCGCSRWRLSSIPDDG